jgi:hypothetical protein
VEAAIDQTGEAVDVVLRDGSTARLRPAHSDDRAALLEFYRHLSPESRYFRFFGKPRVDDIVGDVVRAIDSGGAFTLLAEIDSRIVAIGQYFPGDTPDRAEVAFAISDVQSTVAAPSVSMAGTRRVSTRLREMRHAPSARKTVSTTGNSSGTIEMATVRPARTPSSHWCRCRP